MDSREKAISCFGAGFNCCQSVFSAFAAELGLDEQKALKVAGVFGGGIAGTGETCGAVTGALMAIGLKHGMSDATDQVAKARSRELARTFIRDFTDTCGSTRCRELLQCDVSTPEGHQQAESLGLFRTLCPGFVDHAARILEGFL